MKKIIFLILTGRVTFAYNEFPVNVWEMNFWFLFSKHCRTTAFIELRELKIVCIYLYIYIFFFNFFSVNIPDFVSSKLLLSVTLVLPKVLCSQWTVTKKSDPQKKSINVQKMCYFSLENLFIFSSNCLFLWSIFFLWEWMLPKCAIEKNCIKINNYWAIWAAWDSNCILFIHFFNH